MCQESGSGLRGAMGRKAGTRTVSATSPKCPETRPNAKRPGAQCIPAVSRESRPKRAENYFRVTFCIMGMASSQVMPLSMNMRTVVPHGATVNI